MASQTDRGNRPKDFKEDRPDLTTEHAQVKAWRRLILRSVGLINLQKRGEDAEKGDTFLSVEAPTKNSSKVYQNYLLPLLEDTHRSALPNIPQPRVEARNRGAEAFEAQARELLNLTMGSDYADVLSTFRQAQWDDDRAGIGVFKTVWEVDYDTDKPSETVDPNQLGVQVEQAEEENQNIILAQINESDVDYIHMAVHGELLVSSADPEEIGYVQNHMAEHAAQQAVIKRERPILKRVPWYLFVYDPDVPWDERGWEAEQRSEKVQDMLDWGWKNINEENLRPEVKPAETGDIPFEFCTAKVWYIHDRKTGELLVKSAEGPEEGRFLHKGKWPYGAIDIYQKLVTRPWKAEDAHGLSTVQMSLPTLERLAEIDYYIDRHVSTHAQYQTVWPTYAGVDKVKAQRNDPNARHVDADPAIITGMKEIKPPPIPQGDLEQWGRLMSALRHIVGSDAQDTGGSHPHQISATESAERGEARASRTEDRQRIIADSLGRVAKNFLSLYKKFATMDVLVKIMGPMGAEYKKINPTEIPAELDVYLDIRAETDAGKAENQALADKYLIYLQGSILPVDHLKINDWYGRRCGIRRPSQFLLPLPQGPENIEGAQGQQTQPPGQAGQPQPAQGGDRGFAPGREVLTGSQAP